MFRVDIATAIPVRQKPALPFSYSVSCVHTELVEYAHDDISWINQVKFHRKPSS